MSSQLEILEAEALKLSPEERAELAERLLGSLSRMQRSRKLGQSKSIGVLPKLKVDGRN